MCSFILFSAKSLESKFNFHHLNRKKKQKQKRIVRPGKNRRLNKEHVKKSTGQTITFSWPRYRSTTTGFRAQGARWWFVIRKPVKDSRCLIGFPSDRRLPIQPEWDMHTCPWPNNSHIFLVLLVALKSSSTLLMID